MAAVAAADKGDAASSEHRVQGKIKVHPGVYSNTDSLALSVTTSTLVRLLLDILQPFPFVLIRKLIQLRLWCRPAIVIVVVVVDVVLIVAKSHGIVHLCLYVYVVGSASFVGVLHLIHLTLMVFLRFQRPDLHRVDRDKQKIKKYPTTYDGIFNNWTRRKTRMTFKKKDSVRKKKIKNKGRRDRIWPPSIARRKKQQKISSNSQL